MKSRKRLCQKILWPEILASLYILRPVLQTISAFSVYERVAKNQASIFYIGDTDTRKHI